MFLKNMKRIYIIFFGIILFISACSNTNLGKCSSLQVDPEKCEFGTYTLNQSGCLFRLCRPSESFNCNNLSVGSEYYDGCNTCYCQEEGEVCTEIACVNDTEKPKTIEEYNSMIEYTCNEDSDCVIKDVHNCCGYYPKCVNINSKTDPDLVKEICEEQGLASDCGFPVIESCECINNQCTAK